MSKASTAVAERPGTDLAELEALEAELAGQNQGEIDPSDIQIPLLKIGQPLTEEVSSGDAGAGEFINALTREGLGTEIDFVVAGYQKGRFYHGDRESKRRARKAYGVRDVPWKEDPHFGEPFTEHPDAEEQYSARVNTGEIPWGKGPKISTTYDFTGFVVSEDEEGDPIPVCLSLMRTNSKQARKWATLLQAVLRGRYWDAVFTLTTERTTNDSGNYYTINVRQSRKTTPEERQKAVQLAQVLRKQQVAFVGEDDSADDSKAKPAPAAAGGMEV